MRGTASVQRAIGRETVSEHDQKKAADALARGRVMPTIAAWTALAEKLHKAGYDIFMTAKVAVTDKGFADEK